MKFNREILRIRDSLGPDNYPEFPDIQREDAFELPLLVMEMVSFEKRVITIVIERANKTRLKGRRWVSALVAWV